MFKIFNLEGLFLSKAKKIISMLLVLAMVLTAAPFTLTAPAANVTYTATDPKVSTVQFTVDTSATTEVIRVAASTNSFKLGTQIVPATPSGIPQSSGTYADVSYAGETPKNPEVVFKITGATITGTPSLTSNLNDLKTKDPSSITSGDTTTYTWEITSGNASAGTDAVFTIIYVVNGQEYEAHAFSHVENILVMNGWVQYHRRFKRLNALPTKDCLFSSVIVQLQSRNMYSGMHTADESNPRAFINYAQTGVAVQQGTYKNADFHALPGCHPDSDDTFGDNKVAFATDGEGGELNAATCTDGAQGVLIKDYRGSTDTRRNICVANDNNRAESTVYLDKRNEVFGSGANGLNMRVTIQAAETDRFQYANINEVRAYKSQKTFDNDEGLPEHEDFGLTGNLDRNPTTSYDSSTGLFSYAMNTFSGNGSGLAVSNSLYAYSIGIDVHSYRGDAHSSCRDAYGAGIINLNIGVYDTTDLYNTYWGILRGTGSYTKGVNPQASMYTTGWEAFHDAMEKAGSVLVKPDTNQSEIDAAALALKNAYNGLGGHETAKNVTVKHVDKNTGEVIFTQDVANVPERSKVIGYVAEINGYSPVDAAPQTINIMGKQGEVTEIIFYYLPIENNLYVYTNTDANGDGNIDVITTRHGFGTTVDLDTLEHGNKEFYKFAGFYTDIGLTTPASDFTMPNSSVTLYVKWVPDDININVIMIADGNQVGTKTYTVTPVEGATVDFNRPSTADQPSAAGYLFADFYEDAEFTTQAKFPRTYSVGDPHETIYAKMVDVNGKIIFESNGGTPVDTINFTPNVAVNAPAAPTKVGYTFKRWVKTDGTEVKWPVTLPDQTGFIAYAEWEAKDITISFNIGGTTTKYDTKEVAPIVGPADSLINSDFYPSEPLKFGYVFDGWSLGGARYTFDGTNKFPTEDIQLKAIWRATDVSAFADITSYEKLSGNYVETDSASVGDVVTFRMTTQTNFDVGSSVFVFMYDSNFFELVNEGSSAFAVNRDNEYISGINAKIQGVTDDSVLPWPDMARTEGSAYYKAMMITIDPTITADDYFCAPLNDGKWLVEFQLKVKDNATGSGKVFMSNDWTRTEDNIMGTQFYGWAKEPGDSVADTYNNKVLPNLDNAYAIINIDEEVPVDTTVIINANGGAWADATTEKTFTGRAETEIVGYERPEREGYHLPDTDAWKLDGGDTYWAEGYYEKEGVVNAKYLAQWIPNDYTINYYVEGALYATETATYTQLIPNQVTLPSKQGYEVKGWSLTEGGEAVDFSTFTCPLGGADLYAVWGPRDDTPYTIRIRYINPVQGTEANPYEIQKSGTTDSTVVFLETAPEVPVPNTYYVEWADLTEDLSTALKNNYVIDTVKTPEEVSTVVTADGTGVIEIWYRAKDITITYDANGGTYADGSTLKTEATYWNTQLVGPGEDPSKPGFDFLGWNLNKTATTAATLTRRSADTTYYAVYKARTYPAVFKVNGGAWADGTVEDKTSEFEFGKNVTAPATPVKNGYTFLGWAATPDATAAEALGTMDNENGKTYYAVYKLTDYTVTYKVDGVQLYVDTYNLGNTVALRPAESKTGYYFDGWFYNGSIVTELTMPAENIVLEGSLKPNTYEVIFNANGGYFNGDLQANTSSVATKFDAAIVAPAQPSRNGYEFIGWAVAPDSTDKVTNFGNLTTTETVTYYAIWNATTAEYTINIYYMDATGAYPATADKTETLSGLVGTTSPEYDPTGNLKTGFTFDAANSVLSGVIDADNPLVLTVKYARNQWTYSKNIDGVKTEIGKFFYEADITAPADPDKAGYNFTGWSDMPADGKMPNRDLEITATWTAKTYTVTWDVDGVTQTTIATYGLEIHAPVDPSKTGYTFAGWEGYTAGMLMPDDENLTFAATWTKNSYTITYRTYNGVYTTQTVLYDDAIVLPEEPTREGYTFTGWQGYTEGMAMPAANQVFVAQWKINSYTVTWDVDGVTTEESYNYNAEINKMADPVKTGYTFTGWEGYEDGMTMPAENKTFKATWSVNKYLVKFVVDGATVQSGEVEFGAEVTKPADPTKEGFTFTGWSPEVPATQGAAAATYTAQWTTNKYLVEFVVDGATVQSGEVEFGAAVTKPADPKKEGHTFAGWTPEVPATQGAAAATYTAQWTVNNYTVTWDVDGVKTEETYAYGTAINKKAAPEKTGYTFAGWEGYTDGMTMPAENKTFKATWTVNNYTVTWDVDGATTEETYAYGAAINKMAAPSKEGHTFTGWTGYTDGMTMPAENMTFTAAWDVNDYTVTWVVDGVTVKTETVKYGSALTAPADPAKEGYTFDGWDPEVPATQGAADVTYNATWTVNNYTVKWNVDGEITEETIAYGAEVKAPADPEKEGYTFDGWSPEVPATQGAADAEYVAQWTINEYTITWVVDGVETTETYEYAADITVKADPEKKHYTFEGWIWTKTENAEAIAEFDKMPAYDVTITATFERVPVTLKLTSTAVVEKVEDAAFTGFIYGIDSKLKADDLEAEYLGVEGDGELIITPFKFNICGTGTKVDLKDNVTGLIIETYYIVIFGDINGDSKVDSIDYGMMEDETLGLTKWSVDNRDNPAVEDELDGFEPWKVKAGDLAGHIDSTVGDDNITVSDTAIIEDIVYRVHKVDQTTGVVTKE